MESRIGYMFPQTGHGGASAAFMRQDVGDARVGISAGSSRNAVRNYLYRYTAGNRGTVGEVKTTIISV